MRDPERLENFEHARAALRAGEGSKAVAGVLLDSQMRKQSEHLEDVSDAPALRRQVDLRLRIEQQLISDGDASFFGARQASEAVEQRRLPRT
jgi:hypothetical protein